MTAPVYQWQPSTAQIAQRAGISPDRVVRFDHNTSPRHPPWAEQVGAAAIGAINEYPAADYRPLRQAAAAACDVDPDWVVPGAGADELILLLAKAFLGAGSRVVVDSPTYPLYRIASLQHDAELVEVPRTGDLAFPVERMAAEAVGAAVTWLCVPHNPVGDRIPDSAIESIIAAAGGLVVLDAAYAEFTGDGWGSWVERYEGLVVLHTMSKAYGLAGIRVGYSLSSPAVAKALQAVRPPGSVSSVSQAMAVAGLNDRAWMEENVRTIIADRADLASKLAGIGLQVLPGATNFVLVRVGERAAEVGDRLMKRGLVVRTFSSDGPLANHLRCTARTPADHDRLAAALEEEML